MIKRNVQMEAYAKDKGGTQFLCDLPCLFYMYQFLYTVFLYLI